MRLLVCTQKVDKNDAVLGFFHGWLFELAKRYERVTVICLGKGEYDLPKNVKVLSLGKEEGKSRLQYMLNFYKYIWQERKNYDTVFVHMNEEYVLLGWKIWKLLGKNIYLWRNHKIGSILTRLAVMFSNAVFYTSKGSFTAQFVKSKMMPVGIDSNFFARKSNIAKIPRSILFLGRISPVKNVDTFVDALLILQKKNVEFNAYIYGTAPETDRAYFEKIKTQAQSLIKNGKLVFKNEVPNTNTPEIYNAHEIFVNLTSSGSFDKTIIEAMLCENVVLISNESLRDFVGEEYMFKNRDADNLATKLTYFLDMNNEEKEKRGKILRSIAKKHSLEKLMDELLNTMN